MFKKTVVSEMAYNVVEWDFRPITYTRPDQEIEFCNKASTIDLVRR